MKTRTAVQEAAARAAKGYRDACIAKGFEPKGSVLILIDKLEAIASPKGEQGR